MGQLIVRFGLFHKYMKKKIFQNKLCYKDCFSDKNSKHVQQNVFRINKHNIFILLNKIKKKFKRKKKLFEKNMMVRDVFQKMILILQLGVIQQIKKEKQYPYRTKQFNETK